MSYGALESARFNGPDFSALSADGARLYTVEFATDRVNVVRF